MRTYPYWGLWMNKCQGTVEKAYTIKLQQASQAELVVKNPPAVQETRVPSLDWEDPLEKEMATHSSILAWKISWTEEPGGLQSMVLQSQARLSN